MRERHPFPRPSKFEIFSSCMPSNLQLSLSDRNQAIVLFVDIYIFDNTLPEKILDVNGAKRQTFYVHLFQTRQGGPLIHDDQRAAHPSTVGRNVHRFLAGVEVHADKLAHLALASHRAQAPH